jgi:K+-transporting ATPase ATPase B chain
MTKTKNVTVFEPELLRQAMWESLKKLNPLIIWRNPVMFLVELGSIITTISFFVGIFHKSGEPLWFIGTISVWLWLTVIFSTFAESLAEGRGKARAESLRKTRTEVMAKKLDNPALYHLVLNDQINLLKEKFELISSALLRKGDYVIVETGDTIPGDGEVVEGAALVNESSVTGESAPVVRESGGDRSAVTGGTRVISNQIVVRITANPGEAFLDRMISMVEGAKRRKTPNEIALEVLIMSLTGVFLLVVINFSSLSIYSIQSAGQGTQISITVLIALFVCLAPTTIAALLPAIGIAGMDRLFAKNVIAMSGRAIEASGDVDILLLDKTGTITLGDRQAVEFVPMEGHTEQEIAKAALFASMTDETPEGRSIVVLAKTKYQMRIQELPAGEKSIPFTAQTRMSGVDIDGQSYRKGASSAIIEYVKNKGGSIPSELDKKVEIIAKSGGTPLVVCHDDKILGVIHLKDILKGGIRERFAQLRKMGIKTVMITGDNHLTAAAIAAEAGVDDFLSEAKPEDKLNLIRENQKQGHMVAMTGDGTNDAPALAQADVAVAMNTGTQPAREAANIIDLDSNPTKLMDIVEIGKQILITRGTLTTFSIANDIAKYFAIIPAAMMSIYPQLDILNIMHLANPYSAILSAVIFNAIIIPMLIPLALKGVKYRPMPAEKLLAYNLIVYGVGGIIAPFIGIKIIDMAISMFMR